MLKKIIPILPQIIASLFLTGFMVFAWTGPGQPPPGGNVPAPINTGAGTQYKSGALGIGGVVVFDSLVGIGTTNPGEKLELKDGYIKISGSDGGIIFPDGSVLKTALGLGSRRQVFTSPGTDSFIVPSGVSRVWVTVVGGGGGGGGGQSGCFTECGEVGGGGGGGGGGAGEVKMQWIDVSPGSISITVGAGGAGGAEQNSDLWVNGNSGQSGSQSKFGSVITSNLGTAGGGGNNGGGAGGTIGGTAGGARPGIGGGGGGGAGGTGYLVYGNGGAGGGGGSSGASYPGAPGAAGTSGVVIVEW